MTATAGCWYKAVGPKRRSFEPGGAVSLSRRHPIAIPGSVLATTKVFKIQGLALQDSRDTFAYLKAENVHATDAKIGVSLHYYAFL